MVIAEEKAADLLPDAIFWRAKALEEQSGNQLPPAREGYLQYVAKYPNGALILDAQLGAGRTALAAKQYTAARTDLQKALDMSGQLPAKIPSLAERAKSVQPEAQYLLGLTAMEEKKYDDALRQLAAVSAYNMEPWYSRSLLQMARGSARNGDLPAASRALTILQQRLPESDAAKQAPALAKELGIILATP
jgi:TolA-binding protein